MIRYYEITDGEIAKISNEDFEGSQSIDFGEDYQAFMNGANPSNLVVDSGTVRLKTAEEIAEMMKEPIAREEREEALQNIVVVTTSGKSFWFNGQRNNGNKADYETQIKHMAAEETCLFKLADSTIVDVTKEELEEAVSLAEQAGIALWNTYLNAIK